MIQKDVSFTRAIGPVTTDSWIKNRDGMPVGWTPSPSEWESIRLANSFITILALLTLSLANGLAGILLSAVLYGVGFGSAQPALQAAIIRLVSPERTGVANASFSTATDLGIGLGAIVLGWVSEFASYQVLFGVSAVSVLLSLLMFVYFSKSKGLDALSTGTLPSKISS